jgi:hypothetical protein
MKGDANGFNADSTNNAKVTHSFPNSGLSAGVESGLSFVDRNVGAPEPEQKSMGQDFRKELCEEAAGSKNGKSFKFRS